MLQTASAAPPTFSRADSTGFQPVVVKTQSLPIPSPDKIVVNEDGQSSYPFSRSISKVWKLIPSRPPFWPSGRAVGLIAKEPFGRIAT
jgi:hypothetical protein